MAECTCRPGEEENGWQEQRCATCLAEEMEEWREMLEKSPTIRLGSCCYNVGTDKCVCEHPTNWGISGGRPTGPDDPETRSPHE